MCATQNGQNVSCAPSPPNHWIKVSPPKKLGNGNLLLPTNGEEYTQLAHVIISATPTQPPSTYLPYFAATLPSMVERGRNGGDAPEQLENAVIEIEQPGGRGAYEDGGYAGGSGVHALESAELLEHRIRRKLDNLLPPRVHRPRGWVAAPASTGSLPSSGTKKRRPTTPWSSPSALSTTARKA